ncbi:MAG: GxxExxY protein [Patescibacteria group bacterium]
MPLKEYPYSELTKRIIGLIFEVFNELQFGYQERFYQRAFAYKLEHHAIPFKREQYGLVQIAGKPVGRYYTDFLVDNKVVVELKVANEFYNSHVQQILSYLKAEKLRIGLLCLITPNGIKIKRLIK